MNQDKWLHINKYVMPKGTWISQSGKRLSVKSSKENLNRKTWFISENA